MNIQKLSETLNNFLLYLEGKKGSDWFEEKLSSFYDKHIFLLTDHFHVVRVDHEEIWPKIWKICRNLHLNPDDFKQRLSGDSLTVYDCLKQISIQANSHLEVNFFLGLVQAKLRSKRFAFLALLAFLISLIGSIALFPQFPLAWDLLRFILLSGSMVPVIGLFFNIGLVFYKLYKNIADKHKPISFQIRDNFFLFFQLALRVAGYLVWIILGQMTPITGALFVIAAAVNVVKGIACLIQEKLTYRDTKLIFNSGAFIEEQCVQAARYDYSSMTERNELIIHFVSALFVLGLVAIWSFVPGGMIMPLVCAPTLLLILVVTRWVVNKNQEIMQERLYRILYKIRHAPGASSEMDSVEEHKAVFENAETEEEVYVYNVSFFSQSNQKQQEDTLPLPNPVFETQTSASETSSDTMSPNVV